MQDAAKAAELQAIKLENEYEVTRKFPRAFSDNPVAVSLPARRVSTREAAICGALNRDPNNGCKRLLLVLVSPDG